MTFPAYHKTERNNLRIIGSLYLLATLSAITGFTYFGGALSGDYLDSIYDNRSQLIIGTLFQLVNDAAVVAIGVIFFRVLSPYHKTVGVWILATRIIEAVTLMVGKIGLLSLIPIGRSYAESEQPNAIVFDTLGAIAKDWHANSFSIAMIALGFGGLLLSFLLWRKKLVPVVFPILGLIAYTMLVGNSLVSLFGSNESTIGFLGAALFELVFPLWIIFKGFNKTEIADV